VSARYLPFADAATAELPFGRLVRLGLFQGSAAIAMTLLAGTLNRVMIVELGVPAALVAVMVSLPLLVAPFRALVGFRSDVHRSVLGWKRVPFIWFGSLMQFGGLAIMPFALLLLSGDTNGSAAEARAIAALAFLLVGAGVHTTQTAGLALATDLAPRARAPACGRAAVRHPARRHARQRARLRPAARGVHAAPPHQGGAERRGGDDAAQRRRALEAGGRARRAVP
jgi:BCD family chlorophyll transporter-like MFS transporter